MNRTSHLLPANIPLEEEENPDYDPKRFYPARVRETIQKYQIVSKLGWGTNSTVWLAREINRFVQHPL
jgi:serine/threonine-protein kinase SRPK3